MLDLLMRPGENPDMAWIPRGPTNIAGRTNGIMFDPNDASKVHQLNRPLALFMSC